MVLTDFGCLMLTIKMLMLNTVFVTVIISALECKKGKRRHIGGDDDEDAIFVVDVVSVINKMVASCLRQRRW